MLPLCRYGSLLQGCLAAGRPVLLVGGSGVGKNVIIKVRPASTTAAGSVLSLAMPPVAHSHTSNQLITCTFPQWLMT